MNSDPGKAGVSEAQVLGVPIDGDVFPGEAKGLFGRRNAYRRVCVLRRVASALRLILSEPGERVRCAAQGARFVWREHALLGAFAHTANRTALILTDRRLLMLGVGWNGSPRDIRNQVRLSEIVSAQCRWGRLQLRLTDGQQIAFSALHPSDRKRFVALLGGRAGERSEVAVRDRGSKCEDRSPSLEHLCPSCLRVVPGGVGSWSVCPGCGTPFRDPWLAARLAVLAPGLGALYLGHRFIGVMAFLWGMTAFGLAVGCAMLAAAPRAPHPLLLWGLAAVLFIGPRAIDCLLTKFMGRRGLVPLIAGPAPGPEAVRDARLFPAWAPGLFALGGAIFLVLTTGVVREMRKELSVAEARVLIEEGRFDEGVAAFEAAVQAGAVNGARRVHFALALFRAGDLEDVAAVGIDVENAQGREGRELKEVAAAATSAYREYEIGLAALDRGDSASAWLHVDRALAFFRRVKRPKLPSTRDEVLRALREHKGAQRFTP